MALAPLRLGLRCSLEKGLPMDSFGIGSHGCHLHDPLQRPPLLRGDMEDESISRHDASSRGSAHSGGNVGCSGATQMDQRICSKGALLPGWESVRSVVLCGPRLFALPMDWQQDLHGAIELGRNHSELWGKKVRIVTPDNRRRFLDQSPRNYVSALTRGRQEARMAIPVAYAAKYLRTDEEWTETYFYGGLYCYLAVLPDENINPQCRAMERIFEMTEVGSITVDTPPYLVAYKDTRVKGTLKLPLYRIGKRKLSPDEAMKLVPAPIGTDAVDSVPGYPIGSATSPFTDAPQPGIGASIAPAYKQVPW